MDGDFRLNSRLLVLLCARLGAIALAFLAAFATVEMAGAVRAAQTTSSCPVVGEYSVTGRNPGRGGTYRGRLSISEMLGICYVRWHPPIAGEGSGSYRDGELTVYFQTSNGSKGTVRYTRLANGNLDGVWWLDRSPGQQGTELLVRETPVTIGPRPTAPQGGFTSTAPQSSSTAASARARFLSELSGTWQGTYCEGRGRTIYHFATNQSDPWVGEDYCRVLCGALDYRITNVEPSLRSITLTGRGATSDYSITFYQQADGTLSGTYRGHPTCRTAWLRKTSDRVKRGKLKPPPPVSHAPSQPRERNYCRRVYVSCLNGCDSLDNSIPSRRSACYASCSDSNRYCRD